MNDERKASLSSIVPKSNGSVKALDSDEVTARSPSISRSQRMHIAHTPAIQESGSVPTASWNFERIWVGEIGAVLTDVCESSTDQILVHLRRT